MKRLSRVAPFFAVTLSLALSGCATWTTSEVVPAAPAAQGTPVPQARAATAPQQVILTEGDITDRRYVSLGDMSVTVNKTTIFHPDPTREMVNEKLREEGSKLGADAVIQIRYGTVGIGILTWGSLDGRGRAVAFVR